MNEIIYKPIGVIHSPFGVIEGVPIQPLGAEGVRGTVIIEPEFADGLRDIEGFSHIILIYHFHLSNGYSLLVKPFMEEKIHGVFATRAPKRPNSIGISVVKLVRVENNILHIENVDVVDSTPLLDIKPYVPEFDIFDVERIGWISHNRDKVSKTKADDRFK